MYRRKTLTGSPDPTHATGRIKPCIRKRTFRTPRGNIHQTKSSRTKTQAGKMLFLQETHTVPWTFNFGRWHPTPTRET